MVPTADTTTASKEVAPICEVSDIIVDCLLYLCFILLGECAM